MPREYYMKKRRKAWYVINHYSSYLYYTEDLNISLVIGYLITTEYYSIAVVDILMY